MRRSILSFVGVSLFAVLPTALSAQVVQQPVSKARPAAPRPPVQTGLNFVIEGGVEGGGAKVVELQFTNGEDQTLTAGQGGTIAAGLQYRPVSLPRLSVAGTLGYKFVTNASENASIGITRIPLELVARWDLNEDWWAGAGVVKHSSVNVNGDGFFPDVELDAPVGPTLELGWRWIALTYTALEYTAPGGESFDAGSIGVSMRWVVRRKQ